MGNCCKKKATEDKKGKAKGDQYVRIKDSALSKDNLIISMTVQSDGPGDNVVQDEEFRGQIQDLEAGHPRLDDVCLQLIKDLDLGPELDAIQLKVEEFSKADLNKITDDKDPFVMYFNVKTDQEKDKFHVTVAHLKSHLSPLTFKLANTLISEADELKMTSSYERFYTLFRAKMDGVYYIVNYALYKQIMLFSKKDLLFLKAFKQFDNGDVAEITVSINHPEFEVKSKVERMRLIQSMGYLKKTETGCDITTVSQIYPKVGAGYTILKPLFARSFRGYFKTLDEYLLKMKSDEADLINNFENFKKKNF